MNFSKHLFSLLFFICLFHLAVFGNNRISLTVKELQADYQYDPVGIDNIPQFSWQIESEKFGTMQSAYQIIVSSSKEKAESGEGDIWNSGIVHSSLSVGIINEQLHLASGTVYYWKVQVWQQDGLPSGWSETATFETGLLNQEDWKSGWIGYVPGMPGRVLYFKGTFRPAKHIKSSRAYISGLGYHELYINKRKVGDHVLDPAQSNYSKRAYYVTYNLDNYLVDGDNSIVIPVAQGWLGTPRLRIQVAVTYQDGTEEILTSDRFRSVTTGPIMYSTIFDGEQYDARLQTEALYQPGVPSGLMNKEWAWAHNTDDPVGTMKAQNLEPIKIVEEIIPALVKTPAPGIYVFDAGRNLAGWAAIKVRGKAGSKITLKYAETLHENGFINQDNLRNAKAEDIYIMNGSGEEDWEPAFTYHGFRFVQIEGLPQDPGDYEITIKVVRSSVKRTGQFSCSNHLLNEINQMVVNTEASNLYSIPTDCPQRDERMGWLNDLTVRIEQAVYNFNLCLFYSKFITDIGDTQSKDGAITCVAPFRFGMRPADPVCASYLILSEKCYEFYGNKKMVEDNYKGMKAWVDFLYSKTENGIVSYSYYGDWCPPKEFLMDPDGSGVSRDTPGKMMSTGYLYYCSRLLSKMAEITGAEEDVSRYKKIADDTRLAFNREYWNEETGGYASNNQASNSFALYLGMADARRKERVVTNLVNDVKNHDYHLTTGNLCTKYLLETLTENGFAEVAYKIATQTTYPSWGFMLANGATTLWERWEYLTGDAMNSHNHPMMGSVGSWFYKYVLGIVPDFEHPGFGHFTVKPYIFKDLTHAEGELDTVKGLIKTSWRKDGKNLCLDLTIPANSNSTLYLPAKNIHDITVNGKNLTADKDIKINGISDGYAILYAGSGEYHFKSKI